MRYLLLKTGLLLLMLLVLTGLQAQNKLYLHEKVGTKASVSLNEIRKVTFPSRTITVYQNDGTTRVFPFIDLRQARFTEWLSGNANLDIDEGQSLTLFPNPVTSELVLSIASSSVTSVEIRIMDIQGKAIFNRKERILPGDNQITLQLSNLPQGLYVCRVNNGKITETRKFLKN